MATRQRLAVQRRRRGPSGCWTLLCVVVLRVVVCRCVLTILCCVLVSAAAPFRFIFFPSLARRITRPRWQRRSSAHSRCCDCARFWPATWLRGWLTGCAIRAAPESSIVVWRRCAHGFGTNGYPRVAHLAHVECVVCVVFSDCSRLRHSFCRAVAWVVKYKGNPTHAAC